MDLILSLFVFSELGNLGHVTNNIFGQGTQTIGKWRLGPPTIQYIVQSCIPCLTELSAMYKPCYYVFNTELFK